MTELVFGKDEELAAWAEATFPEIGKVGRPLQSIGVADKDGELMAVAIFNNFGQNERNETYDLQVTFVAATPNWATPGNIRAILHYPFIQLGVKRMTAITDKSNKRARKLNEGLGFVHEGTHPYGDAGERPSLTYGLYRDEAMKRFFPEEAA